MSYRRVRLAVIIAVLGVLLTQTPPASAENWFLVAPWDQSGVCQNDNDEDGMRDDWLELVTRPEDWSSLRDRVEVFKLFYNMLRTHPLENLCDPTPIHQPLTTEELGELVDALQGGPDPVGVGFEVGGIRLGSSGCPWTVGDPDTQVPPDITGVGACQAAADILILQRWTGSIDVLNLDHALGNNWCREGDPFNIPNSCNVPWQDLVREMVDYLAAMHVEYPDARLGIYEGPALFNVHVDPSTVYPARGLGPNPPTFEQFIDELLAAFADKRQESGLEDFYLSHYDVDHAPHAVDADGDFDGTWDFGRITAVEQKLCSRDVTVGMLAHPGRWFVGPPSMDPDANDLAYGTTMRYFAEYRTAGGDADTLIPAVWHTHPNVTGPEDEPSSGMKLGRDMLDLDAFLLRTYRGDEFDDQVATEQLWQLDSPYSVTGGRLELEGTSGAQLAALDTPAALDSVIASFTVHLPAISGGGNADWAGLQLRKAGAGDRPWHSGYLVLIGADQVVRVLRANPGSSMVELDSTTFSPDPTIDDVDIRVELIADHFRVYVNDVIELDFDIAPGDVIAPGADLAGLISFNGPASFERFDVAQALPTAFEDAFDAGCGDWLPGCLASDWQVTGAAGSERLEAPATSGLSLQTLDTSGLPSVPATPASYELSARVVPHEDDSNWGGVFLRQSGPFWTSSYLVFVKSDGEVGLRIPGEPVLTTSVTIDPEAGADLKVRVVGDRITVSVDHCPVFDEVNSQLAAGDLGLASFRNSGTGASALFDDVELTILPD